MKLPSREQIMDRLATVNDPELHKDLVSLNMVKGVEIANDGRVDVHVELTTPACPLKDQITAVCTNLMREASQEIIATMMKNNSELIEQEQDDLKRWIKEKVDAIIPPHALKVINAWPPPPVESHTSNSTENIILTGKDEE